MRILSQEKYEIDLPYKNIGISVIDKTNIIAYPINNSYDDDFWGLAIYSTETKTKKAIKMLREAYIGHIMFKMMTNKQRSLFLISVQENEKDYLYGVFRFPENDEIEVD